MQGGKAVNKQEISGEFEKLKGKAEEAFGNVTNNEQTQAKGQTEQMKGEAKKTGGQVEEKANEAGSEAQEKWNEATH